MINPPWRLIMKLYILLFLGLFFFFSAQAQIVVPAQIEQKMKNAIGMVAISGFGRNVLATGFFISDKLFVTEFLAAEQLRRMSGTKMAVWIRNQYFGVKRAYALYGSRNLAILEIESSYEGGVLELSKEGTPTEVMYGAGFDIGAIQVSGYHITGEQILRGLGEEKSSRYDSADVLSIMPIKSYHKLSGYQFYQLLSGQMNTSVRSLPYYQLTGGHMHTSTNGLPFLNQRGEVIGMKFGNIVDLAFATPVEFLRDVVKGKGHCDTLSLQDCLDKAVEDLYEEAKSGDPIAQYAHNDRLYTNLDEAVLKGDEAIDWLMASAETGNVLSQLQAMMHITSHYQCFALPEGQENTDIFSEMLSVLQAIGRIFTDKEEMMSLTLRWLEEMRQKDFAPSYFLTGLMYLNGHCVEQDIEASRFFLTKANQKGFTPIDFISTNL